MNADNCGSEALPDFFYQKDAPNMQDHLICNDLGHPNVLSHLVAVPMHKLSQYTNDPSVDVSRYLWKLKGMNCNRLLRICGRLGITKDLPKRMSSADCVNAILRQPGNRTFRLKHVRVARAKSINPSADPVGSSSVVPPTLSVARKKPRLSHSVQFPATGAAHVPNPVSAHPVVRTTDDQPPINVLSSSSLGRLDWDSFARILDQRRKSIVALRTQERDYVNTVLMAFAANEEVRRHLLQSWEAIQRSIQVEERALEQLRAHYDACIFRATGGLPPASAANDVPPASADSLKNHATTGLNEK